TGQKPFFWINYYGDLELKGIPINPNPEEFFKQHPPDITSYMYARFLHSNLNKFISFSEEKEQAKTKIKELNERIILRADSMLKNMHLDYAFMIYDNIYNDDGDWREKFLAELFLQHRIPYINTLELIAHDPDYSGFDFDHYIIRDDG